MIKQIEGKHGIRYIKDGQFIAKAKLTNEDLDELYEAAKPDPKGCLFCGIPSRLTRFLDMQTVYLCEEHYHAKSIGNIAHKLRERTYVTA